MELKTLIADSKTAFINGQFDKSLELAQRAILADKTSADAYGCAANASMSLEKYDQAVSFYKEAVKNDQKNGDRYFQLGYALASSNKSADALKALTMAEELKCSKENTADLYHLIGLICFEGGRFDDALINLKRAEYIMGPDLDIMNRIAIIYGMKNDVKKGLFTTNQMKLIAPSQYSGYKLGFNFLIQAKQYDKAKEELKKAEKYANLTMDYYTDQMSLEIEFYRTTSDKKHFTNALEWLSRGLSEIKPAINEVVDTYINAAEIYLQLEQPDRTIDCLNAVLNPVESFNMGFKIIPENFEEKPLTEYDVENMIEELAAAIDPDESGNRDYLTDIEEEDNKAEEEPYRLDPEEKYKFTQDNKDQINRLFIGAYTLKKDFEQVIRYSKMLQGSESSYSVYMGRYTEVNALRELGRPEAETEYDKLINFLKHSMMVDPSDTAALSYRIQCLIDIEKYDEAEQLCSLLNNVLKEENLKKIRKARSGGEK